VSHLPKHVALRAARLRDEGKLNASDCLVLRALWRHVVGDLFVWPSVESTRDLVGGSMRTVQRSRAALEHAGLLSRAVEERNGRRVSGFWLSDTDVASSDTRVANDAGVSDAGVAPQRHRRRPGATPTSSGGDTDVARREKKIQEEPKKLLLPPVARVVGLGPAASLLASEIVSAQSAPGFPTTCYSATLAIEANLLEALGVADPDHATAIERVTATVRGAIRAARAGDPTMIKRWGDRMVEPSWLPGTEAIAKRYPEGTDGERVGADGAPVRLYAVSGSPRMGESLPPAKGAF